MSLIVAEGLSKSYGKVVAVDARAYIPTRVINATLVLYNPSSETVPVEHTVSLKSSLAPTEKVQTITYFAAPIGIILAMPWLLNVWKQRKQK
jgi:hypothetical protein